MEVNGALTGMYSTRYLAKLQEIANREEKLLRIDLDDL